jgi:histidinol-phosphate aminotransferase
MAISPAAYPPSGGRLLAPVHDIDWRNLLTHATCSIVPRLDGCALPPSVHGGFDYAELGCLGLGPDDVLDFSVNSNPFGPPPGVREVWSRLSIDRYPDRACLALRAALAEYNACPRAQVWVGNGTSELIWLLGLAYLRPGDAVVVVGPTYGEYAAAGKLMQARVETFAARQEDGFRPAVGVLADALRGARPRLTFLCNPNNPTGVYLPRSAVEALVAANPEGLLVLDEAYAAFVAGRWDAAPLLETGRVAVLRSMTKDCALAGLRLGYLLACDGVVEAVRQVQPPWSVNAVAQAAGLAALQSGTYRRDTLAETRQAASELRRALSALGLRVRPSDTHFFLVQVGDASRTRADLLRRGVLVRDCTSFGLPAFVRVAARRPEENRHLVAAWRGLLEERDGDGG